MSPTQAQRVAGVANDKKKRDKRDFYPTPAEATEALLAVEKFTGPIWEPACGDGAISNVLTAAGYQVQSTDLWDYGFGAPGIDFLMEWIPQAPNIITNPPFKLADEFTAQALKLASAKVAIFARLQFLEGQDRKRMFESTPLARVHVFSWRVPFKRGGWDEGNGGGGMQAFAWFVWDKAHQGPPTLSWL